MKILDGEYGDSTLLDSKSGSEQKVIKISAGDGPVSQVIPDPDFIQNGDFTRDGHDLVLRNADGQTVVIENYFLDDTPPVLTDGHGNALTPQLVNAFLDRGSENQFAQGFGKSDISPVGTVSEISGSATVVRSDGSTESLTAGSPIFEGDVVRTEADGAVNIEFSDESSFSISEDAQLAIDEYVYDPQTSEGTSNFSFLKGLFVYTSGLIGQSDPDEVNIETPVGSIGIRGTTVLGNLNTKEFTVTEGGIVIDSGFQQVTMTQAFQTVQISGFGGEIIDLGVADPVQISQNFQSIRSINADFFSTLDDAIRTRETTEETENSEESESGQNQGTGNNGENQEPADTESNENAGQETSGNRAPEDGEAEEDDTGEEETGEEDSDDSSEDESDNNGDEQASEEDDSDTQDSDTQEEEAATNEAGSSNNQEASAASQDDTGSDSRGTGQETERNAAEAASDRATDQEQDQAEDQASEDASGGESESSQDVQDAANQSGGESTAGQTQTQQTGQQTGQQQAQSGSPETGSNSAGNNANNTNSSLASALTDTSADTGIDAGGTGQSGPSGQGPDGSGTSGSSGSLTGQGRGQGQGQTQGQTQGSNPNTGSGSSSSTTTTTTEPTVTPLQIDFRSKPGGIDEGTRNVGEVTSNIQINTVTLTGPDSGLLEVFPAGNNRFGIRYKDGEADFEQNSELRFSLRVSSNDGQTETETVRVGINDIDEAPGAENGSTVIQEDTGYIFKVSDFGFTQADGLPIDGIVIESMNGSGTLYIDANNNGLVDPSEAITVNGQGANTVSFAEIEGGLLKYAPAPDAFGANMASFSYSVQDAGGVSDQAYVMQIGVTPVNDAPVAGDAFLETDENTPVNINFPQYVSDVDDTLSPSDLTIISVTNGTTNFVPGFGTFTFNPDTDFSGDAVITYEVRDASGATDTGTITITVNDIDTVDPVWTTAAGTIGTVDTGGIVNFTVLATDESSDVTYTKLSGDSWLNVDGAGQITGTAPGTAGPFTITVRAEDLSGNSADRTFEILVTDTANTAPTLDINTGGNVNESGMITITASELDASDADSDTVTYTVDTAEVAHGTLFLDTNLNNMADGGEILATTGTFTQADINNGYLKYMHDGSETLSDGFGFTITDGTDTSALENFNFTITPVNDAPVVSGPTTASLAEDAANSTTVGTAFSFTDAESNGITWSIEGGNADGIFGIDSSGQIFVADNTNLDFESTNSYTLTIRATDDGTPSEFGQQTVTVDITDVAEGAQPILVSNNAEDIITKGTIYTLTPDDLDVTDTDTPPDQIEFSVSALPVNGTLSLFGGDLNPNDTFTLQDVIDGEVRYQHNNTVTEFDSFEFTYTDGLNAPQTGTFHLEIAPTVGDVVPDGTMFAGFADDFSRLYLSSASVPVSDWDSSPGNTTGATSDEDGAANTAALAGDPDNEAAVAVDTLTSDGHSDWYLPSIDELQDLYNDGLITTGVYWSSTEIDGNMAYAFDAGNGNIVGRYKGDALKVLAMRKADTNANDPELLNDTAVLDVGDTYELSNTDLNIADADTPPDQITIRITDEAEDGILFLDSNADGVLNPGEELVYGSSFTMRDVLDGNIYFQHDGAGTTPDDLGFVFTDGTVIEDGTLNILVQQRLGPGNDTLTGDDGDNIILGEGGNDTISGGPTGATFGADFSFKAFDGTTDHVFDNTVPTFNPPDVTFDGQYFWAISETNDEIIQFDPESGFYFDRFPTPGDDTNGIAWDGKYLWVSDGNGGSGNDDTLSVISPEDGTVINTVTLTGLQDIKGLTWDGEDLWAVDAMSSSLSRIDTATGNVVYTAALPVGNPKGVAYDGENFLISDGSSNVYVFNPFMGVSSPVTTGPGNVNSVAWDGSSLWEFSNLNSTKFYGDRIVDEGGSNFAEDLEAGDTFEITGTTNNDGIYTVKEVLDGNTVIVEEGFTPVDNNGGNYSFMGGNDVLDGGAGTDELSGQGGNDTLKTDGYDNVLDGGAGIDRLLLEGDGGGSFSLTNITVSSIENVDMQTDTSAQTLNLGVIDNIFLNTHDNKITVNVGGNDTLNINIQQGNYEILQGFAEYNAQTQNFAFDTTDGGNGPVQLFSNTLGAAITDITFDDFGNSYVAEGSQIRKFSADGTEDNAGTPWPVSFGAPLNSLTIDDDGFLYAGQNDGMITKLDPAGNVIWSYNLGSGVDNLAVTGNAVYAADGPLITKLNADSGFKFWDYGPGGTIMDIAVDGQGFVYTASDDGRVRKIDPAGNEIWNYDMSGSGLNPYAIVIGEYGNVIVGTDTGEIINILSDGSDFTKQVTATGSPVTEIVTAQDGSIYVGGQGGELVKFDGALNRIWKDTGTHSGYEVTALAVDDAGNLLSTDSNGKFEKSDVDGIETIIVQNISTGAVAEIVYEAGATITVNNQNFIQANSFFASTPEDNPLTIDLNDPLNNIINSVFTPQEIFISGQPENGSFNFNAATGEVTYTPDTDFFGQDSFTYSVIQDGGVNAYVSDEFTFDNQIRNMWDDGEYLYVADEMNGLLVFKKDTDGSLVSLGNEYTGGQTAGVAGDGTYIYAVDNASGELRAFTFDGNDIMMQGNVFNVGTNPRDILVEHGYIFVADGNGITAYDFDGTDFTQVGAPFGPAGSAESLWSDGNYIYVADGTNGIRALDFDGSGFAEIGNFDTAGQALDIVGDGTYFYVADGSEGVKAYTFNGSAFTQVAVLNTPGNATQISLDGKYIYVADEISGLTILEFDGTNFTQVDTYFDSGDINSVYNFGGDILFGESNNGAASDAPGLKTLALDGLFTNTIHVTVDPVNDDEAAVADVTSVPLEFAMSTGSKLVHNFRERFFDPDNTGLHGLPGGLNPSENAADFYFKTQTDDNNVIFNARGSDVVDIDLTAASQTLLDDYRDGTNVSELNPNPNPYSFIDSWSIGADGLLEINITGNEADLPAEFFSFTLEFEAKDGGGTPSSQTVKEVFFVARPDAFANATANDDNATLPSDGQILSFQNGNDTVTIDGQFDNIVFMGSSAPGFSDTINLSNGASYNEVYGENGDDIFNLDATTMEGNILFGGAKRDVFNVDTHGKNAYFGGEGHDLFKFNNLMALNSAAGGGSVTAPFNIGAVSGADHFATINGNYVLLKDGASQGTWKILDTAGDLLNGLLPLNGLQFDNPEDIIVNDTLALVYTSANGFSLIDSSDPSAPTSAFYDGNGIENIIGAAFDDENEYVYTLSDDGGTLWFRSIDIGDPQSPTAVTSPPLTDTEFDNALAVFHDFGIAYVVSGSPGLARITAVSTEDPVTPAVVDSATFTLSSTLVSGQIDEGFGYFLISDPSGDDFLKIYDLRDPADMREKDNIDLTSLGVFDITSDTEVLMDMDNNALVLVNQDNYAFFEIQRDGSLEYEGSAPFGPGIMDFSLDQNGNLVTVDGAGNVVTVDLGLGTPENVIDGGHGDDTLVIDAGDTVIDFSQFDEISNIERIVFEDNANTQTINLDIQEIISMTDDRNILRIEIKDTNDTLNISGFSGTQTGVQDINENATQEDGGTKNYDVYTDGNVTLLVDDTSSAAVNFA